MQLDLKCEYAYHPNFISNDIHNSLWNELVSVQSLDSSFLRIGDYVSDTGKIMFTDQDLIDQNVFPTEAWGIVKPWPKYLQNVKHQVEDLIQKTFQVCVGIYYPDGNTGVDYHTDPPAFGDTSIIPSVSLGEERLFSLKEKSSSKTTDIILQQGSLFVMGKGCQELYEHALPIDEQYKKPRINLTFRPYGY